jgi:glycosyltransferase involved in cell wall biosynthesis
MPVGTKRNMLLQSAQGEYIAFIDDDDMVSAEYVDRLIQATKTRPACISFKVQMYINETPSKQQRFFKDVRIPYLDPTLKFYKLPPNHLCAWRRDVVKEQFQDISLSEDHRWAEAQLMHYKDFHNIDEVLYHYYYNQNESETHKRHG